MIDVLVMRANDYASRSGDVELRYLGSIGTKRDSTTGGTLTFQRICPHKFARWKAAELMGSFAHDSARVRFNRLNSNSTTESTTFFLNASTMTFDPVVDTSQWDDEWTEASLLANLDLWTAPDLQIIVHLVRTNFTADPTVTELRVLMDLPTWEGAVAAAARKITEVVGDIEPVLLYSETLSAPRAVFKLGVPHSEYGYTLTSVVLATVNGLERQASVSDGAVVLAGVTPPAGAVVEIAVKFTAKCAYLRGPTSRVLNQTPFWTVADLVVDGGLVGEAPKLYIAGHEVHQRRIQLELKINGTSTFVRDAFAMRAALQARFSRGLQICLPSGRGVFAQLDGLVELVDNTDPVLPMASGLISVAMVEYIDAYQFRNARNGNAPVYTELELDTDGFLLTLNRDSITTCSH